MEMELGLKFTRADDEFTSDFQFAKDRAGPLYFSRETDLMFVLTAHLKGYKRGNIKIDINEDGSLIGISGERQVKETVVVGWKVYKNDAEVKGFKRAFKIPKGVNLDKIRARFNEDESTLTITMPKKVKGISGTAIEEVEEKQELVREGSGRLQIADEKIPEKDDKLKGKIGEDDKGDEIGGKEMPKEEKPVLENACTAGVREIDAVKDGEERQPISTTIDGRGETEAHKEGMEIEKKVEEIEESRECEDDREDKSPERFKLCIPVVAGSALLLSLVVFVIQIVRSKSRRRD